MRTGHVQSITIRENVIADIFRDCDCKLTLTEAYEYNERNINTLFINFYFDEKFSILSKHRLQKLC